MARIADCFSRTGYCGSKIATTSKKTTDSECNMACSGSNRQYCGAGNRMQVYHLEGSESTRSSLPGSTSSATGSSVPVSGSTSSSTASSSPTSTALAAWRSLGCYSEVPGRALQAKTKADNTITNEVCAEFCSGYKYFATEYAVSPHSQLTSLNHN